MPKCCLPCPFWTTAAGKLALYLKEREIDSNAVDLLSEEERSQTLASRLPKRQRKVLLVAADVYRPAAIQQLEILGKSIDVTVFSMGVDVDPALIAKEAVEKAKLEGYDTVLVDTAGRQVVDEELMEELRTEMGGGGNRNARRAAKKKGKKAGGGGGMGFGAR